MAFICRSSTGGFGQGWGSIQIQIYTGLADIGLWLDVSQGRGGVKVKRRGVRSQGCHGDLRSGPSWRRKGCLSVAWPRRCGQSWTKATSWWTGKSLAADTWTDGQERGTAGLGERMNIMRGLDMQRSQFRGQSSISAQQWDHILPTFQILTTIYGHLHLNSSAILMAWWFQDIMTLASPWKREKRKEKGCGLNCEIHMIWGILSRAATYDYFNYCLVCSCFLINQ